MGNMMKQAQQMQTKMLEIQEKIAQTEFEGNSGAGMVKVIINGRGEMRRLHMDPKLVDPNDVDMICDLIVAAFNDAKIKSDQFSADEMGKVTGGLGLPGGMKLPF